MKRSYRTMIAGAALVAASAYADIPGLFVVQESKISDPGPTAVTTRTNFGYAQFAPIGDVNGDKVQDLIVGAPNQDSGALQILLMDAAGKPIGGPTTISARHSLIKPYLSPTVYPDFFGTGTGVVVPFSDSKSCSVVLTSSAGYQKLWALKICRNQPGVPNGIDLTQAVVFDTTSPALSGLGLKGLGLGTSITVLDTLSPTPECPEGERLVAVSATQDGLKASPLSKEGRVLLMSINPTTLAMKRVAAYPETWTVDANGPIDPLAKILKTKEGFGNSIAPWRGPNGQKGLVVVGNGYVNAGSMTTGRVHVLTYDASYKSSILASFEGSSIPNTTGPVFSVTSGDIDHDGISDLALGYNAGSSAGALKAGQVKILLLKGDGTAKDSTSIWKGLTGFVDSSNALAAGCWWGSKVSLVDLNGDQQLDLLVGAQGNSIGSSPEIVGSLWTLRLKQAPWRHKNPDSILLAGTGWVQKSLKDYVTGNQLIWSIVPGAISDPVATCKVSGTGLATVVECQAGMSNGTTKVRVAVRDSGNIPATVHYTDTLEFPIRVSGINNPPVVTQALPVVTIAEDHLDTAVLVFSKYFSDPDGKPMTVTVTGYTGTVTSLLTFHQSANFDTLYLAPVQFKNGKDSLRIQVKDDFNATIEGKLQVVVTHVNHVPTANADNFEMYENTSGTFDVVANDKDDDKDALTPVVADAPKHGKVSINAGKAVFVPDSFYVGDDAFTYKANDGKSLSAAATVKVKIKAYNGIPLVYRPLKNDTVPEDAPPVQIHADSLFFSGITRFEYEVDVPTHNCQSLADVSFDSKAKILNITPFKYQSGQCDITLRDHLTSGDVVTSKMTFVVSFVAHPYKFKTRQISDTVTQGVRHVVRLDSLDLDRKELEYVLGAGWPTWAAVEANTIVINPPLDATDFFASLSVRKKAGPGESPNPATDAVDFSETVKIAAGIHGRKFGGLRLDLVSQPGKVLVQGGAESYRLELFGLQGGRFVAVSGAPFQSRSIDLPVSNSTVYMRLEEGSRKTIAPLLLNH